MYFHMYEDKLWSIKHNAKKEFNRISSKSEFYFSFLLVISKLQKLIEPNGTIKRTKLNELENER